MIKCTVGNKPCGNRCVPNSWKCKETGLLVAIAAFSAAVISAGIVFYKKMRNGDLKKADDEAELESESTGDANIIKKQKSLLMEGVDPRLKKELNKAIIKTITIKELSEKHKINPQILEKIPSNIKISVADTFHPAFGRIAITGVDALNMDSYDKFIVSSKPNISTETLGRELCYWYQSNTGKFIMSDAEYKTAMKNLTPVQRLLLSNVETHFGGTLKSEAELLVEKNNVPKAYEKLKRAQFEAYYLTTDWDKLEKIAKKRGLI